MAKDSEMLVKVENVSKVFKLPHEKLSTVKQHFVNIFNPKSYEKFKALDSVSFEIKKGEFFGIIGANGSGKSTLLKILAGIYQPTSGKVTIAGSLSPFIELGVGFNPELTARENVFLNAAILGLSKKQTEEKFDQIIDFAELREFLDQKLKNFSSGMQVRLAFSIAIQAEADILVIDEVLAVGDSVFQQKCFDVFYKMKKEGKTIIFVSHELGAVRDFCDRVLLMQHGKVKTIGAPNQAILQYLKLNSESEEQKLTTSKSKNEKSIINSVASLDATGARKNVFDFLEDMVFEVKLNKLGKKSINFGIAIYRADNTYCFGTNTLLDKIKITSKEKFRIKYTRPNLLPGDYYLIVAVFGDTDKQILDYKEKVLTFKVFGSGFGEGVVNLKHSWETHE
ncbi:MAG TPA: ABC transporter ATP-binding protein [Candidatus Saccharimonadales bacterium]|nr:ABC transporter ATP-binding protein [Candidatus Saccharimonadales bacterium]